MLILNLDRGKILLPKKYQNKVDELHADKAL